MFISVFGVFFCTVFAFFYSRTLFIKDHIKLFQVYLHVVKTPALLPVGRYILQKILYKQSQRQISLSRGLQLSLHKSTPYFNLDNVELFIVMVGQEKIFFLCRELCRRMLMRLRRRHKRMRIPMSIPMRWHWW